MHAMRLTIFTSVLVLLMSWGVARADTASTDGGAGDPHSACASVTEPDRNLSSPSPAGVGAGVVFDEHLLTDARRDEDYNGGGEITFSGRSGGPIGRALDRALGAGDEEDRKS